MAIKTTDQTPGSAKARPPGPETARPAPPRPPQIGTDGLQVSAKAAAAGQSEAERLAAIAERAKIAAGAGLGVLGVAIMAEREKPGTLRRVAAGAALALSPVWAPIGVLWQFGLGLGQGLKKKEFAPGKSFSEAVRSVGGEMNGNWRTLSGQGRSGAAAAAGSGPAGKTR